MKTLIQSINEGKVYGKASGRVEDVKFMFTPGQDGMGSPGIIVGKPFRQNDSAQYKYEEIVSKYFKVGETQVDPFEGAPKNQLFVWFVNTSTDDAGSGYISYFGGDNVCAIV